MTEATKHALLSPSGADGWFACPGKPAMEKGLPNQSSEHSDYGTAAHEVASQCLTKNLPAKHYKGVRIDVSSHKTVECDDEMVEGVQCYVDMVRQRIADYKVAGATSVEMLVEQRVPIGRITGEDEAYGTADVVLIVLLADGTALIEVIDLKFGKGIQVFAEKNKQGMLYALGAVEKFSIVTAFDRVRITIHQPRLDVVPTEYELPIDELMVFKQTASERAYHALQVYNNEVPEALTHHLKAGEHCRKTFCKARATCPKAAQYVTDAVGSEFGVLASDTATPAVLAEVALDDPQLLAVKFKAIDFIEDWCKAVRARVEAVLFEKGNSPEIIKALGVKLVQGRQGARAWSDKDEVEKVLKSMRLKIDEMYDFSLISPTTAEKVLATQPKRWAKLTPLISRSEGKPSVALATDKRAPLNIKPAIDEFDQVAEDVSDLV
jgi:Protein of unknown function (DUF2800)